jgi:hypothetical protein
MLLVENDDETSWVSSAANWNTAAVLNIYKTSHMGKVKVKLKLTA